MFGSLKSDVKVVNGYCREEIQSKLRNASNNGGDAEYDRTYWMSVMEQLIGTSCKTRFPSLNIDPEERTKIDAHLLKIMKYFGLRPVENSVEPCWLLLTICDYDPV